MDGCFKLCRVWSAHPTQGLNPRHVLKPADYEATFSRQLNQIILTGLRSSKDYYKRPVELVGVYEKGKLGFFFLGGWWVGGVWGVGGGGFWWVLRGTGTASGHPGVS